MTSLTEQFSAVPKAQFEAQFDFFNALAAQALERAGQLVALNLATSRDTVQRSIGASFALVNPRDPRDLLKMGDHAEEQMRCLLSYGQELFGIASGIRPAACRALPAARAMQLAIDTADTVTDALTDAAPAAAPERHAHTEPAAAAPAPVEATPVAGPTIEAAPSAAAEPSSAAEAVASVAEPVPVALPTAIAIAAGKGSAHAATAPHPSSAPVAKGNATPKLVTPSPSSRRRK
jgi:hypothetical protein